MRKLIFCAGASLFAILSAAGQAGLAQDAARRSVIGQSLTPPAYPNDRVQSALIHFPLPKGEEKYGDINGKAIHKYVVELAEISRRYRDNGHPRFWGRLTGFSSGQETEQWLAGKLRTIGMHDVRIQKMDLTPQWVPTNWDVTLSSNGKTLHLTSAQPDYRANALPKGGVELDAVYAGMGTEADFAGKDVKGKAVFVYTQLGLVLGKSSSVQDAVKRAGDLGAAAIFEVSMLPGNMIYQAYPSGTQGPAFTLGNDDGTAAREMLATAVASGLPAKVKVSLETEMVPNLKSGLVWGTLPGITDETVYITAHWDGWFDGASDNAGGVASALGTLEHFAKVPQSQRRRTIVFVGLDGHHNATAAGNKYLTENKATLFAKTALVINDEHPSTIMTQSRPRYYPGDEIAWSNTMLPLMWYAGGKDRPELNKIVWDAFKTFGAPLELDANPRPPAGDGGVFFRFAPTVAVSEFHSYFHTNWETPETVPWTSLEASARAHAKIIDEVNKLPLSALQRPEEPPTPR